MLPFRHSLQNRRLKEVKEGSTVSETPFSNDKYNRGTVNLKPGTFLMCNRGFSLIEMLISMAILGILLAAIATIVYSQNKHHAAQNEIAEMQNNARMAMDFVTRTMRGLDRDETDALLMERPGWFTNEGVNRTDLTFVIDEQDFNGNRYTHRFQVWGGWDRWPEYTYIWISPMVR
ncbi:prepilin-type N-terminal cleavage/methylation domain-containing protein [Thermodesulfovibrionales bacterium]|nr:prepilin-type N-terminal cleavage/methylation domain-containing protein [Thermodesulfovibrionales bacterium]